MSGFEELPEGTEQQISSPGGAKETVKEFEELLQLDAENNQEPVTQKDGKARVELPADGEEPEHLDRQRESDSDELEVEAADQDDVDDGDFDDDDDEEQSELYAVTVDGEEIQVPLDELANGYIRQSSFTKKTRQLAEERRQFEQHQHEVFQERQAYSQLLGALENQLKQLQGEEPNWVELSQNDPVSYVQQKEKWDVNQRKIRAAQEEQQRIVGMQQQQVQQFRARRAQEEREQLLNVMPQLRDKGKAEEFRSNILDYADHYGLTPQDLASFGDHRVFVILDKARQFDALENRGKGVAKKVQGRKGPVMRPGSAKAQPKINKSATRKAKERLAHTGDLRDAAAVFETLL